ncbi:MAG: DinB family protein [Saprospiraceae bacterium]|nr:DinB family protein [Saprospiraceae bacterium]
MLRSQLNPMPEYFDRYINLCDDVELLDAIRSSIIEAGQFPLETWKKIGDKTYAEGKWSLKEILQHLIDTERIFGYRALAFARNEIQRLPSYSEDEYASASFANNQSFESLLEELKSVHQSFLLMYQSFTPEMLEKKGMGFKGEYSVASIGFIMAGHQRWHSKIIEERYLPLL